MYDSRLISFNQIMHRVPWKERKRLILKLNACKESKSPWEKSSFGESLSYKKQELMFDIYRTIQGEPYMQPRFSCFVEIQDILNRRLSEKILRGINGYLAAPIEKQRAFQRNLLNPWTPKNLLARIKGHNFRSH